ncbi:hypothetical protein [Streptomyces sp. RKAG337]|uniref:hypothetical protein n=1 Tax=Streptomyces sp. RKAG337 TaxID=2893404 RepID=UPI002033B716|nr:hypothetical protein [Streptomyces sp. RKAG337]MCM2430907.1 hypothetical protein [Streptomyces sp. RKAG337]
MTSAPHTEDDVIELMVRVSFSEICFYETYRPFEIPRDIAHDEALIREFISEIDPDDFADDTGNENFEYCTERTVEEVSDIQTARTPAMLWLDDGVLPEAINRYRERVQGPDHVWLADSVKRPTGLCRHCKGRVQLRRGALAAKHCPPLSFDPCSGVGELVSNRDEVVARG